MQMVNQVDCVQLPDQNRYIKVDMSDNWQTTVLSFWVILNIASPDSYVVTTGEMKCF